MRVERSVRLPIRADIALQSIGAIHGKELARIAGVATSSGEASLERSGLMHLDEANQCHFGAQLGHPVANDSVSILPLRWWNDRSRSLTPGFIGRLLVSPIEENASELRVSGDYHPRAHLYELVDRAFLSRLAYAVVTSFVDQLSRTLLAAVEISAA